MQKKFLGLPYPIVDHPMGYFHTQTGINQIKSDILCLLLTYPGERVMLPEFGTPLKDLIFEPADDSTINRARQMIISSLALWEPRVEIRRIEVFLGNNDLHPEDDRTEVDRILSIRIIFVDPENIQEVQQLDLQVPLTSSSINSQPSVRRGG